MVESLKQSVKWDARGVKRGTESTTGFQRGAAGAGINGVQLDVQGYKRWLLETRKCTKGCREYKGYKRVQGIKGEQGTHGCNKVSRGCRQIWHSGHGEDVDTSGCKRVQEGTGGGLEGHKRWVEGGTGDAKGG